MAVQVQFRRGAASEWTNANPILAEGELGLELDSNKFKLGNGFTRWNNLLYTSTFNVGEDTSSDTTYPTYVTGAGVISAGFSTEGFVYKPSVGNLGIGTTNPTSKLWVGGSGYFIGSVTSDEGFYVNGELIGSSILGTNIVGTSLSISGASNLGETRIRDTSKLRFGGTSGLSNFYIQYNSTTNSLDFVAE